MMLHWYQLVNSLGGHTMTRIRMEKRHFRQDHIIINVAPYIRMIGSHSSETRWWKSAFEWCLDITAALWIDHQGGGPSKWIMLRIVNRVTMVTRRMIWLAGSKERILYSCQRYMCLLVTPAWMISDIIPQPRATMGQWRPWMIHSHVNRHCIMARFKIGNIPALSYDSFKGLLVGLMTAMIGYWGYHGLNVDVIVGIVVLDGSSDCKWEKWHASLQWEDWLVYRDDGSHALLGDCKLVGFHCSLSSASFANSFYPRCSQTCLCNKLLSMFIKVTGMIDDLGKGRDALRVVWYLTKYIYVVIGGHQSTHYHRPSILYNNDFWYIIV